MVLPSLDDKHTRSRRPMVEGVRRERERDEAELAVDISYKPKI